MKSANREFFQDILTISIKNTHINKSFKFQIIGVWEGVHPWFSRKSEGDFRYATAGTAPETKEPNLQGNYYIYFN